MPELLLELLSEEIPARMQRAAASELEKLVVGALSDRGLLFDGIRAFSGPRRLMLAIGGLPARQKDVDEERKGPRTDAPEKAIQGFLRSAGVTLAQCETQSDGKGTFYVARVHRPGRALAEVLAELLPEAFAKLSWPKSMRWPGSAVRWVRPLHAIVCTLDGEVVPFEFAGIASGNTTLGHRFLSSGPIAVRRFDDYVQKLHDAHVIVDPARRREIIVHALQQQAFALGLEWIVDEALADEVSGLVEWPVVMCGRIDEQFMDVPGEILRTAMRTHQKYFSLRPPGDDHRRIASRFVFVANMLACDRGAEIVAGNERVLRARLSDAKFFWDQDRRRRLETRIPDLKASVFHAKAGSMHDRACRISLLAMVLSEMLDFDTLAAQRAGLLAKADLASGVVGEFPELQGIMGSYYALHDGEEPAIAAAIRDHYRPQGPNDAVPEAGVSIAVALADKIDTLVTLWRAGEKPTGSKDPFALRRAGLGIIRIILENRLRLVLSIPLYAVIAATRWHRERPFEARLGDALSNARLIRGIGSDLLAETGAAISPGSPNAFAAAERASVAEILAFLAERLKVALRERGMRHDLVDAVFSLGHEDDLLRLVARVDALQAFLQSGDGVNLLAGYRRAANILPGSRKRRICAIMMANLRSSVLLAAA